MYQLVQMNRVCSDFYHLLGPIFGSREISKEIGINVYDDEDKKFFVAKHGEKIAGILSIRNSIVSDCYVYKQHRGNGILKLLLSNSIEPGKIYRANCTEMSVNSFRKSGFIDICKTKNFYRMIKNA